MSDSDVLPPLRRGDCVRLVSGGPVMVVTDADGATVHTRGQVRCLWFDATGKVHNSTFVSDLLRAVPPPAGG